MKELKQQLRLLIASRLLKWAHNVAPDDEGDGSNIKGLALRHFKQASK